MAKQEDKIIEEVAKFYFITKADLLGINRSDSIATPRQIAMFLLRDKLKLSYPSIGKILNRDHTTAVHAYNKINKLRHDNKLIGEDIEKIEKNINNDGSIKNYIVSIINNRIGKSNTKWHAPFDKCRKCGTVDAPYGGQGFCLECFDIEESERVLKMETPKTEFKKYKKPISHRINESEKARLIDMLNLWNNGETFKKIGLKYAITTQRVQQLMNRAIFCEFSDSKFSDRDFTNYCNKRKEEIKKNISLLRSPKKPRKIFKARQWSREYSCCVNCKTIENKHVSRGYCTECYPKSEYFKSLQRKSWQKHKDKYKKYQREYIKEYNKRPEVIEKIKAYNEKRFYGGNRQNALKRDCFKCIKCGLTQKESYEKSKKDLYVEHKDGDLNNNKLDNLITVCYRCHNNKYLEAVREGSKKIGYNNSLKVLSTIRQYNIECGRGIDIKTLVLLLGGELQQLAVEKHIIRLLNDGKIKQKYGSYLICD